MTVRTAALPLVLACLAINAFATDTNNFILVNQAGKTMGKASYTIAKTKDGFKIESRFAYHLSASAKVDSGMNSDLDHPDSGAAREAQCTAEYKLDVDGNLLSGSTQNSSVHMMSSFQPNKKRDAITVGHIQEGVIGESENLAVTTPQFLLAPDYDPSAIQMLLTTALTHPHPNSNYLLIVPSTNSTSGDGTLDVTLQPAPDTPTGILDGKPIVLKHYVINYQSGHADLYADVDGTLMEAVMDPLDTSYIRAKFNLSAPPSTR